MHGIGRFLVMAGLILALIGAGVMLAERVGIFPGRLPGDLSYRSGRFTFYFPLATSLILSAVLSLVLWLLSRR